MVAISGHRHGTFFGAAVAAFQGYDNKYSSTSNTTSMSNSSWSGNVSDIFQVHSCNVSAFVPTFPPNQTQLVVPNNTVPSFIGLAFGVQNYTCTSSNNFTNVGAFAELIDVSCLTAVPEVFNTIQDPLFAFWSNFTGASIQEIVDLLHFIDPPEVLAQHYFVTNPTTGMGVSPKWDFTSSGSFQSNPDAFIIAKGKGSLPAPTNATTDVNWLDVVNVEGSIASEVFRVDTRGGQPPASCVFDQTADISVKYVSKYILSLLRGQLDCGCGLDRVERLLDSQLLFDFFLSSEHGLFLLVMDT
ncbi:hypothetical protein CERSUDRAFT_75034 [Gelatoporia subvermispora B]|uniref:Uncharacterized protein n=1 Tax=Ceriporiopsis subvermispora (strain B) TaxID=914234 RepID=M2R9L7_CERS8|nr:hypothetical protein CERSUDRAFT_75034 [Gelatoporia subvermispora B]